MWVRIMNLGPCKLHSVIYFTAKRSIFSRTGVWVKKITKTQLLNCEKHWKDKTLNPTSYRQATGLDMPKPKYILSMFPYPSGDLHMGHMRVYTISDVLARFHRLNGEKVIHPIGWDAFGLPAENAAIDRGASPRDWTDSNIEKMREQLKELCISFDWDREIKTCDPEYYKWTQNLFLRLYKRGLAYRLAAEVNWDPVDQTVLADEQIDSQGRSWRSGAEATKKYLKQWYLRTTDYSQSLVEGLDTLDPESCKGFANAQRSWIRHSNGVRVNVTLQPSGDMLPVFTIEPELIYGAAFLQVSPNHHLAQFDKVQDGLLTSHRAIHPLTGSELPILVRESTELTENNTTRLGLPVANENDAHTASRLSIPYTNVLDPQGRLVNSADLSGLDRNSAQSLIRHILQERGIGGKLSNSELKDWLISRQRYWGTPIPIVHCDACGEVPVPEAQLPVVLPRIESISRGGNPLLQATDWLNTTCPSCGGAARRETDTMDTFVDSSWYFLRYLDPGNETEPFNREAADEAMPVDVYIGGAEHATLHMYFARFFTHALRDMKMVSCSEPFTLQLALGQVSSDCYQVRSSGKYLSRDQVKIKGEKAKERGTGHTVDITIEKMSKSKYNGVLPKEVMDQHGVDQSRLYMLANASPRAEKYWNSELVKNLQFSAGRGVSIPRLMHTLWHTISIIRERRSNADFVPAVPDPNVISDLRNARNTVISDVTRHLSITFDVHEAIYSLLDALDQMDSAPFEVKFGTTEFNSCFSDLLILLHPFIPHISAELWEGLRTAPRLPSDPRDHDKDSDIFSQRWPHVDDNFLLSLNVHQKNLITDPESPIREDGIPKYQTVLYRITKLEAQHLYKLNKEQALRLAGLPSDTKSRLIIRPNVDAVLRLERVNNELEKPLPKQVKVDS